MGDTFGEADAAAPLQVAGLEQSGNGKLQNFLELIQLAAPYVDTLAALASTTHEPSASQYDLLLISEKGLHPELFARAVHECLGGPPQRRAGEFLALDPDLGASQLEEELFNYSDGDRTDGKVRLEGLLVDVQRGSLFLPHVERLTPNAQRQLSSLCQRREFRRPGERFLRRCDAALMFSATVTDKRDGFSGNLTAESIASQQIPPLRECREFILDMVGMLTEHHSCDNEGPICFTTAACHILKHYAWPGNIAELASLVEELSSRRPGQTIDAPDLGIDGTLIKSPRPSSSYACKGLHSEHADAATTPLEQKLSRHESQQVADTCPASADSDVDPQGTHSNADIGLAETEGSTGYSTPFSEVSANESDLATAQDAHKNSSAVECKLKSSHPYAGSTPFHDTEDCGQASWRSRRVSVAFVLLLLAILVIALSAKYLPGLLIQEFRRSSNIGAESAPRNVEPEPETVDIRKEQDERMERADALIRAGRVAEAKESIDLIADDDLDEGSRQRLIKMKRTVASELERRRVAAFDHAARSIEALPIEQVEFSAIVALRSLAKTPLEQSRVSDVEEIVANRDALLSRLVDNIGNVAEYREALTDYASAFPDSKRAKHFTKVAEVEVSHVDVVDRWNALLDEVHKGTLLRFSLEEGEELRTRAEQLLLYCGDWPSSEQVRDSLAQLAPMSQRDPDGKLRSSFLEFISSPSVNAPRLYAMDKTESYFVCYISSSPAVNESGEATVSYFADMAGSQRQVRLNETGITRYLRDRDAKDFFKSIVLSIEGDGKPWDSTFIESIEGVRAHPDLRPAMKLHVMREMLMTSFRGSAQLKRAFGPYLSIIRGVSGLDLDGTWLDPLPQSPSDSVQRENRFAFRRQLNMECVEALNKLEEVAEVCVADASRLAFATEATQISWIGCIVRKSNGQWVCRTRSGSPAGNVLIVRRERGADSLQLEQILLDAPDRNLLEGMPAFIGATGPLGY